MNHPLNARHDMHWVFWPTIIRVMLKRYRGRRIESGSREPNRVCPPTPSIMWFALFVISLPCQPQARNHAHVITIQPCLDVLGDDLGSKGFLSFTVHYYTSCSCVDCVCYVPDQRSKFPRLGNETWGVTLIWPGLLLNHVVRSLGSN